MTLAENGTSPSADGTDYGSVVITPSRAFADRMCACQDRMWTMDEMMKSASDSDDACLIEVAGEKLRASDGDLYADITFLLVNFFWRYRVWECGML